MHNLALVTKPIKLHVPTEERPRLGVFTGPADGLDAEAANTDTIVEARPHDLREIELSDSPYAAARLAAARSQAFAAPFATNRGGAAFSARIGAQSVHPLSRDVQAKAAHAARDLEALRQRRLVLALNRLFDRRDLADSLAPAYRQLRDDSLLFQRDLRGYRLQSSVNLQRVGGLGYRLALPRAGLCSLLLAAVADVRPERGALRIEIRLPSGELAARASCPAATIEPNVPVRFDFPPLEAAGQTCGLAVFADGVDVPLSLLEWRKYRFFGLGRTRSRAFCGLLFS